MLCTDHSSSALHRDHNYCTPHRDHNYSALHRPQQQRSAQRPQLQRSTQTTITVLCTDHSSSTPHRDHNYSAPHRPQLQCSAQTTAAALCTETTTTALHTDHNYSALHRPQQQRSAQRPQLQRSTQTTITVLCTDHSSSALHRDHNYSAHFMAEVRELGYKRGRTSAHPLQTFRWLTASSFSICASDPAFVLADLSDSPFRVTTQPTGYQSGGGWFHSPSNNHSFTLYTGCHIIFFSISHSFLSTSHNQSFLGLLLIILPLHDKMFTSVST